MDGEGQPDVGPPPMYNPYADDRLSIDIGDQVDRRASYHAGATPLNANADQGRLRSQSYHPGDANQPHHNPNNDSNELNYHNSEVLPEAGRHRAPSRSPAPEEDYAFNNFKANSKHKSQYSDDAGSIQEDNSEKRHGKRQSISLEEIPGRKDHGKLSHNKSGLSLDKEAAREVFRDEFSTVPPTEGVKFLCILILIILLCVLVGLCAPTSGILITIGVFGNVETVKWNYGYAGRQEGIGKTKTYLDNYTKQVAADAGAFYLTGLLVSLVVCGVAFFILTTRYSGNLPLYVTCCSIRIPQRQTLSVLFGMMKTVFWITTMWYLIVCFHGLLEMNFYIDNNCTSGTCYTYVLPSYGWINQVIIVLIMSCCLYNKFRRLDPPLQPKTVKFYFPEHEKIAESERAPIKLLQVLDMQDLTRKIMIYSAVCWFMQRCGYISIADLESGHSSNIMGVFIPIGWYNVQWSKAIDTKINSNLVSAGTILGTVCAFVGWSGLACFFYLLYVVVKFKAGRVRRTLFRVLCSLMTLLWLFGGGLFYYRFYLYWNNGGKNAVSPPDSGVPNNTTGAPTHPFWFPSWGFIFWFMNVYYLLKLLFKSFSSL